jgi:hypothetical protein
MAAPNASLAQRKQADRQDVGVAANANTALPLLKGKSFLGVMLVSMGTLMYEILLTRIFSVTMWYHFAFMAVSIAMFGMTAGAVAVFLKPHWFSPGQTIPRMAQASLACSLTLVTSFLIHLFFPVGADFSMWGVLTVGLTYVLLAIPFILGGIVVTLFVTRFPSQIGAIYAADLGGAALGCLALIHFLEMTDGPTTVFACATGIAFAAALFADEAGFATTRLCGLTIALGFLVFIVINKGAISNQESLVRLRFAKGEWEPHAIYEKWNTYSRIRVVGDERTPDPPFGWGMSPTMPSSLAARQLFVDIDANAGTVLTGFAGDPDSVRHLRYDISNLAHYIRSDARVLVIGAGGGRDILSALTFRQKHVTGVEINNDIIDLVTRVFAPFTGNLHLRPDVRLVNDEARSHLTRNPETYDLIQVSLIDSWAATAAGAFVLSENTLYTIEAWRLFLSRLTPTGVLSFSRWYIEKEPSEVYRLFALAIGALRSQGVPEPRRHLFLARVPAPQHTGDPESGVGTLLVSPAPFSDGDLDRLEAICEQLRFEPVFSARHTRDEMFTRLGETPDLAAFAAGYPKNIAPPTDDSPFFFHITRLRDTLSLGFAGAKVESFLLALLGFVGGLTALCIILPLWFGRSGSTPLRDRAVFTLFFAGIGLGFMLVEMAFLQWLFVLLGHPTYSLSVVLFSVLLSAGLGSFLSGHLRLAEDTRCIVWLGGFTCLLVGTGWLVPHVAGAQAGAEGPARILTAIALIFPLGLFMGTAFPQGMSRCLARCPDLAPWLWGINGAMSITGSVVAVLIALEWGISAVFWTGTAGYLVAFVAWFALKSPNLRPDSAS